MTCAGVIFGHAGDAHVHVNPLIDVSVADWRRRANSLFEEVTALAGAAVRQPDERPGEQGGQHRLDHREVLADAGARAAAERQVLEAMALALCAPKSLLIERIRIFPQRLVAMDEPGPDRDDVPRSDVLTPEPVRSHGLTVEARNRWIQAQRLCQYLAKEWEPVSQ